MTDLYNLTNLTNANDIGGILVTLDVYTGHYLVSGVLVAIFLVSFISMKAYDSKSAFAASVFGTTVLAIILNTFVEVNRQLFLALIIGCALAVVALVLSNDQGV